MNPPAGAGYAEIRLMYQSTSWEYIQFLYLANDGQNAFLANEGAYLLEAWLNTGMAEPVEMAELTVTLEPSLIGDVDGDCDVDLTDLALVLANFDCTGGGCTGDVDGDGDVDLTDLAQLLANFDAVCGG